jgi:hypothetical protein
VFQRWRSEATDPQDAEPIQVLIEYNPDTRTPGPKQTCIDETDAASPRCPKPKAENPIRSRSFKIHLHPPEPPTVLPQQSQVHHPAQPAPAPEFAVPQGVIPFTQRRPPFDHKSHQRKKISSLTQDDVDRIRQLRLTGEMNPKDLAKMFGVTPQYVKLVAPVLEHSKPHAMMPAEKIRNEQRAARFVELQQKKQKKLKKWAGGMGT